MIGVSITYEAKHSMQAIQDKFRTHLSDREIQKTTAFAINQTGLRVAGFLKKDIKKEYAIKNKYLARMTKTTKKAKGTVSGMYAEISHLYTPIPIIAFNAVDTKTNGVNVEIKKGQKKRLPKMFIRTMKSGHIGVYARGEYKGGKFIPAVGNSKITEIKSASPFTMATNKGSEKKLGLFIADGMPKRLEALLQVKLNKMKG